MGGVSGRLPVTGDPLADRLAALRARFVARAEEDRRLLAALGPPFSPAEREQVRLVAHRLAGAAGTFGYPEASEAAFRLEEVCETGSDDLALREALDGLDAALAGVLTPASR